MGKYDFLSKSEQMIDKEIHELEYKLDNTKYEWKQFINRGEYTPIRYDKITTQIADEIGKFYDQKKIMTLKLTQHK